MVRSPDDALARVKLVAVCHDCERYHHIDVVPALFGRMASDWEIKHRGHKIELITPQRVIPRGFDDRPYEKAGRAPWWLSYQPNSDMKIAYTADAAFAITLANLASSSDFRTGVEATAIDNTGGKYVDYDVYGKITTGTGPIVNSEIRLFYVRPIDDAPSWPDVFDGTASAETVSSVNILSNMPMGWGQVVDSTNDFTYPILNALTLAQVFNIVPDHFTVFLSHNTNANLKNNAPDQAILYRGIYFTS